MIWQRCSMCRALGYHSPKFKVVLCDRHYFEMNGKLAVEVSASAEMPFEKAVWAAAPADSRMTTAFP